MTRNGIWSIGHGVPQEEVRDYNRTFFCVEYLPATRIGGWRAAKIRPYFVAGSDGSGVPALRFVVRPDDALAHPRRERDFATLDEAIDYAKELVGPGNIEASPPKRVMMLDNGATLTTGPRTSVTEGDVTVTYASGWLAGSFVIDLSVEQAEHMADNLRWFASHQRRVMIEGGEGSERDEDGGAGNA